MISKYFAVSLFVLIACFGVSLASVADNDLSEDEAVPSTASPGKGPMVGGWTTMDLTDSSTLEKVQKLTDFAVKSLNAKSNDFYHMVRMGIVEASRQLVAGLKYSITFYLGQTDCTKNQIRNEELTTERCPVSHKTEAKFSKCTVILWEKPWQNFTGLLKDDCAMVTRQIALQENANSEDEAVQREMDKSMLLQTNSLKLLAKNRKNAKKVNEFATLTAFRQFTLDYNKTYENITEMKRRYQIFKLNMKTVEMLQRNEKGTAKYGVTMFSDLMPTEFFKKYTGYRKDLNADRTRLPTRMTPQPLKDIPTSFDWRTKGAVTEVKNQGSCGSCWAFSTTGNIEGVWKVKKGQLIPLSEQQLVDCDKIDEGCGGGEMSLAYKEIERMGGLETEKEYPYKGVQRKCTFNRTEVEVYINDSVALPKDEKQMAQYMYQNGPIAIGINASPMMFYMGGISHPWKFFCNPKHLNHGVSIVGYGVEGDKPFWIIKNSWGASWGESGYIRLYRGAGVCGVDQDASSVIIN